MKERLKIIFRAIESKIPFCVAIIVGICIIPVLLQKLEEGQNRNLVQGFCDVSITDSNGKIVTYEHITDVKWNTQIPIWNQKTIEYNNFTVGKVYRLKIVNCRLDGHEDSSYETDFIPVNTNGTIKIKVTID